MTAKTREHTRLSVMPISREHQDGDEGSGGPIIHGMSSALGLGVVTTAGHHNQHGSPYEGGQPFARGRGAVTTHGTSIITGTEGDGEVEWAVEGYKCTTRLVPSVGSYPALRSSFIAPALHST